MMALGAFLPRSSHTYGRRHLYGLLTNYELWDTVLRTEGHQYLRPSSSAADRAKYLRLVAVAQINNAKPRRPSRCSPKWNRSLTSQREGKIKAGSKPRPKRRMKRKSPLTSRKPKPMLSPFSTAISTLERGLAEARMHSALQADDLGKGQDRIRQGS